jgi:hypothetical protein
MLYQVVEPITMAINGGSFKDAVKNFVKMNHELSLTSLILTDQQRYMRANLNFYKESDKHKVGISLFPTVWPLTMSEDGEIRSPLNTWPYSPSITYDTKEYPSTTFMPRIIPLVPTLGSLVSPLSGIMSLSNHILPNPAGVVYNY